MRKLDLCSVASSLPTGLRDVSGRVAFSRVAFARAAFVCAASFLATSLAGLAGNAVAAVRLCEPAVSSGLVTAPTELEAKKNALDAWKAKAAQHGEPYASWRLAADRMLECLPHKNGGFECLATGAPCTIEHAPDRRENRENRFGT